MNPLPPLANSTPFIARQVPTQAVLDPLASEWLACCSQFNQNDIPLVYLDTWLQLTRQAEGLANKKQNIITTLVEQNVIQSDSARNTFSIKSRNTPAPSDVSLSIAVKILLHHRPKDPQELALWASHAQELLNAIKDKKIEGKEELLAGMQVWKKVPQSTVKMAPAIHRTTHDPLKQIRIHRDPLIQHLLALGLAPALFARAHAVLTRTLSMDHWVDDRHHSLRDLRTLIPTMGEPVDILKAHEAEICAQNNLSQKSACLKPLLDKVSELIRLRDQIESTYPNIAAEVTPLIVEYQNFIRDLCKTPRAERAKSFIPKAIVVGDGIDFFYLPNELALKLLCKTRFGLPHKTNQYGIHSVVCHDSVFYKPNPELKESLSNLSINPGMEYAIVSLLQLMAGEHDVAAPTAFIKVLHAATQNETTGQHDRYIGRVIQAGLGVPGISFQHLIDLVLSAQKLSKCASDEVLDVCYDAFLRSEALISAFLEEHSQLQEWLAKPLPKPLDQPTREKLHAEVLPIARDLFRAFPHLEQCKNIPHLTCFYGEDYQKQTYQFDKWLGTASLKLLVRTWALMPKLKPLFDHYSFDALISLVERAQHIPELFPNTDASTVKKLLPDFLSRIDPDHFCSSVIGHLLANPTDAKPDNFQVRLIRNAAGHVIKLQIVGIDNDRALAQPFVRLTHKKKETHPETKEVTFVEEHYHCVGVKCILFLLDAMKLEIPPALQDRLTARTPLEWLLDYAKLLYDQSERMQELTDQHVLLSSDLREVDHEDKEQKTLDIPLQLDPRALPRLYSQLSSMFPALKTPKPALAHVFEAVHPMLFKCYAQARSKYPDAMTAYGEMHRGLMVEQVMKQAFVDPQQSYALHSALDQTSGNENAEEERTLSVKEAIAQFFAQFNWESLPEEEQLKILDRCGKYFPTVNIFPGKTPEWKNQKLRSCTSRALAGAVDILLRQGAAVNTTDEAGQTVLHLLFNNLHRYPENQIMEVLGLLLAQSTLNLNSVDDRKVFPLLAVVNSPDTQRAIKVLERLSLRGIWWEQTDSITGESALDKAVKRDKVDVFIALVRLGAGLRMNVDATQAFMEKNKGFPGIADVSKILQERNPELAYRVALGGVATSSKPDKQHNRLVGADHGSLYLQAPLYSQVFDTRGHLQTQADAGFGRRTVVQVAQGSHSLHAKENPELPGMEYAVGTLRRQLIGHGAPYTELFKCQTVAGEVYPLQLAKSVTGDNLHSLLRQADSSDKGALDKLAALDIPAVWEMILTAMLINPEDDKPDNYIVTPVSTPQGLRYRLICVDNDHAFVEPLLKGPSRKLQVKCILFCLDVMNNPIHPQAIETFLRIDPESAIEHWLKDLEKRQGRFVELFTHEERKKLFEQGSVRSQLKLSSIKKAVSSKLSSVEGSPKQNTQTPTVIPIPLHRGLVLQLLQKLLRIQTCLRENPYITGIELLKHVIPELGTRYEVALQQEQSAYRRFDSLTEDLYSKAIAGRYGTMINSHQMLKSLDIPTGIATEDATKMKFGPAQALKELEALKAQAKTLNHVRQEMYKGNLEPFSQLQLVQHQEAVINELDFKAIKDLAIQEKIIAFLVARPIPFSVLNLSHCRALNMLALKKILQGARALQRLNLSYCPAVTDAIWPLLEKECAALEQLNLAGTALTQIENPDLPQLQKLTVSHCWQLNRIFCDTIIAQTLRRAETRLSLPKLRFLKADHVSTLTEIVLDAPVIVRVDVHNCKALKTLTLSLQKDRLEHLEKVNITGCEVLSSISEAITIVLMQQVTRSQKDKSEKAAALASESISTLNRSGIPLTNESLKRYGIESWRGIRIPKADLSYANLEGLDLTGADLRQVQLKNTNLRGVNLREANLTGVQILMHFEGNLQGHTSVVNGVALTPDGRMAISGSPDNTVRVWDLESGKCITVLEGHTGSVERVALTPDGRKAISASADKTLRVWDTESEKCIKVLEGHTEWVFGVVLTPDGRMALSGSGDNTVRVWDLESGKCLNELTGHTNSVFGIALTLDGRMAISGSGDKTVRVWDLESGKCLHVLNGHTDFVNDVAITPDGRMAISVSDDKTIRVWDLESGKCLHVLNGHTDFVKGIAMTSDGRMAISGSKDNSLRVWDLKSGKCLKVHEKHTVTVKSVAMTPDGRKAISGSYDRTLRVWDLNPSIREANRRSTEFNCEGVILDDSRGLSHNNLVRFVKAGAQGVASPEFLPPLSNLVPDQGSLLKKLVALMHSAAKDASPVTPLSIEIKHRFLTYLWNIVLSSRDEPKRGVESGQAITLLNWAGVSMNSESLQKMGIKDLCGVRIVDANLSHADLSGVDMTGADCQGVRCTGANLRGVNLREANLSGLQMGFVGELRGHTLYVHGVALTQDGRKAISGGSDHTVRVWDLESGACLLVLEGHTSYVRGVALTPDGRKAISGSLDHTVRVWDLEGGVCLRVLEGHTSTVMSVALTQDGRKAISGSDDQTVRVWDLESGACLLMLEGHTSGVTSFALTQDGRKGISGGSDHTVRVWDLESGACLRVLEGHTSFVDGVALTQDRRKAISGSGDHTIRVWDLESGACLRVLEGHTKAVNSVALTPDGRMAISGSKDHTVQVWDLESGVCLRVLKGHTHYVNGVALTPDGRMAISGSSDKTVRIWDLDTPIPEAHRQSTKLNCEGLKITVDEKTGLSGNILQVLKKNHAQIIDQRRYITRISDPMFLRYK